MIALLVIGGAVYFLTRGGDTESDLSLDQGQVTEGGDGISADTDVTTDPADPTATTAETIAGQDATAELPPVVSFDEAAVGPIQSETEYQVGIQGGPSDALYRILVDDEPQAEPAAQLAPTVFAPGRHLLVVEITSPSGTTSTDPVVVYALGPIPEISYRANLSSVNIATE